MHFMFYSSHCLYRNSRLSFIGQRLWIDFCHALVLVLCIYRTSSCRFDFVFDISIDFFKKTKTSVARRAYKASVGQWTSNFPSLYHYWRFSLKICLYIKVFLKYMFNFFFIVLEKIIYTIKIKLQVLFLDFSLLVLENGKN